MHLLGILKNTRVNWNSSRKSSFWSGDKVRHAFLDFFANQKHAVVPSGSVIAPSFRDSKPLPFVNAGMVRWRPIFMDEVEPPDKFRNGVVNSQKCIRVGGKACDLEQVGHDGHHHTFFEMLGNWAFKGAYGREKSCTMAWELLTNVYQLPPDRLFVTYFGGCDKLNLPADNETKQVWLSLGVDPKRILPFGATDNFWQMGFDGPCGPCTEIHYSHVDGLDAKNFVNANNQVVEIWNLVFMEHYRHLNGNLQPLSSHHVDTGAGLERLTAVLGGSQSNYDSDLFIPLFEMITQQTKAQPYSGSFHSANDTAYRILADHVRMATVCLADGLLPDSSPKMRNVLRRALRIQRDHFGVGDARQSSDLMFNLSLMVMETLRFHFPLDHAEEQENAIRSVLDFEAEHLKNQDEHNLKAMNKLIKARPKTAAHVDPSDAKIVLDVFNFLDKNKSGIVNNTLSGELAFKIFDSFGARKETMQTICDLYGIEFGESEFDAKMDEVKSASKLATAVNAASLAKNCESKKLPPTDDSFKHSYEKQTSHSYKFPIVSAEVLDVVDVDDQGLKAILLDKTCCYGESGGQAGDEGSIMSSDNIKFFNIVDTLKDPATGHVWHMGHCEPHRTIEPGKRVNVQFKVSRRIMLMQGHTGVHLLNCVLHKMFRFTRQQSSSVGIGGFKFDFIALNATVDAEVVNKIEEVVNMYIDMAAPVERIVLPNPEWAFEGSVKEMLTNEFDGKSVILMPEETYPKELSVISLPDSVEPCCGTHVLNTADVQGFVILSVKSAHPGQKSFRCLTGQAALESREAGIKLIDEVLALNELVEKAEEDASLLPEISKKINKFQKSINSKLPYTVKVEVEAILNELIGHIADLKSSQYRAPDYSDLLTSEDECIVHNFGVSVNLKKVSKNLSSLQKPCLILSPSQNDYYKVAVNIPASEVTDEFNADRWLSALLSNEHIPLKKQGTFLMVKEDVHIPDVNKAIHSARLFAENARNK